MSVSVCVTKVEMADPNTALVSVIINCDLGQLNIDVSVDASEGNAQAAVDQARDKLRRFGNELMNAIGTRPLRMAIPQKRN
jgi:hypothetical protein